MKLKVVLTKGFKKNKVTRTLKLGKRSNSKNAHSSIKDLSLPKEKNNNITIKKVNNSKSKNKQQSNSKNKLSHTVIKAREKPFNKNFNKTEQNQNPNQTTEFKNSTISNTSPYQKINILKEKKRLIKTRENSYSNTNLKKYNHNNYNLIDKNKKIYFKTPIKIRNIMGHGAYPKKLNIDSNINKQYLNKVYTNNNEKNNNTTIMNLQKELELLKKEKLYKTMLITNMKQQIEEYQKQQQIIYENNLLKEEIEILKNKYNYFNNKDIFRNSNNKNIYKSNDLFDALKYEYFNSQNQVMELKKENNELKTELNNKLNENIKIQKNIEIYIPRKIKQKNINDNNTDINKNGINQTYQNNNLNKYIEMKYKEFFQKEKDDINDYYKPLKEEQIKEIRFLIKMTLNSNKIAKNKILNFIINNLTNLNNIINSLILDFIKTNSTFDIVLLRHYFTLSCINQKNKAFDINNLFNEINYYYDDKDKAKNKFKSQKIYNFLSNNENIKQLINECKFKDQFNIGIIELNEFNEIFIGAYGNYINNEKNKDLYDLLIYVMKNYYNLNDLGLYHLCYQNLNYDTFLQKSNSREKNKIRSVNNNENDNLGKNENDSNNLFNRSCYTNLNKDLENNSDYINSDNSSSYINQNRKKISTEDVIADVSINVEQSTALVNVKFKSHYDSDFDNNSVVQTSINGLNSNGNNEEYIIKNENNEDEEENIFITNEDYQVCMDFVANIFDICLEKLHRYETVVHNYI